MLRTKLVGTGTESALDTATTLDNATVIRVYNGSGATATVSVAKSTSVGYADTATVSIPSDVVEFFEKGPNDQISASVSTVVGFKVGYTA